MTIAAEKADNLPAIIGTCGPVVTVAPVEYWRIVDDESMLFGLIVWDRRVDASIYAERVAELLEEHGLLVVADE